MPSVQGDQRGDALQAIEPPVSDPSRPAGGTSASGALAKRRRFRISGVDYDALPRRVRQTIVVQQQWSEILIGWVQLSVVITFGALYFLSPKPQDATGVTAPEPWFLGLYLCFTLVRLVLAHQRRLPDWLLYLSVVIDMVLLLALIWSIHVKYDQPASFYLKVPTLLYVFIFIALRALRYEIRFVLVAGTVAACGWLLMVAYVITVDPQNPMITRDYVEYMTSNSVLLGAEFDKVISILLVTAILAVAISRAQRLLVQSVVEASAVEELAKFVPTEVARQAHSADETMRAGQGEVGEATIFFSDIEGFTTISEQLTPTELIGVLNDYFTVVSDPITRRGGVINQFQGDAILATFNMPDPHPDHARAATEAAVEIQRQLSAKRFGTRRLRSRIGINTGEIVGGLVGTGERLGYTVHGDDVNLAARLEQLNKEYGTSIILSESTVVAAGDGEFSFRKLGTTSVRGREKPLVIYTVDSTSPGGRAALDSA